MTENDLLTAWHHITLHGNATCRTENKNPDYAGAFYNAVRPLREFLIREYGLQAMLDIRDDAIAIAEQD